MRAILVAILMTLAFSSVAEAQVFGELRGGVFAHAVDDGKGDLFNPSRLQDANVEFLFKPIIDTYVFGSLNAHVGATAHFSSNGESYAYGGLTYHLPIMVLPVFVEAGLGAALSSKALGAGTSVAGANQVSCAVMGHAEGSVGFDFAGMADVMLTAEHYFPVNSCGTESAVTNIGARVGLSF